METTITIANGKSGAWTLLALLAVPNMSGAVLAGGASILLVACDGPYCRSNAQCRAKAGFADTGYGKCLTHGEACTSCDADDDECAVAKGETGAQCTYKEPGTTSASCEDDGDCYSGYCKESCTPGPCCQAATDTVREEGRSYDCESDAECEAVAPGFVRRGGTATCYTASNVSTHSVCVFNCTP